MPIEKIIDSATDTLQNTKKVTKQSLRSLWRDPSIMVYPLLAGLFVVITLPLVSGLVLETWHKFTPDISVVNDSVPHPVRLALGFVTFTYFYTAIVATYFSCAVSAAVLAKLEGHPTGIFHGLQVMFEHFWRISRFAILSIFFIPLAFVAQRRKLPKGIIGVVGSSIGLHTAQMAPAIINEHLGVSATIRESINTLGKRWHEGLVIKVSMYALVFGIGFLGFLPRVIHHYQSDDNTTQWIAWLVAAFLSISVWVTTKVLSAVFITALYHQAKTTKNK